MDDIDLGKHQRQLQKLGYAYNTIRHWTGRKRRPSYEALIHISEISKIAIDELVRWFVAGGKDGRSIDK